MSINEKLLEQEQQLKAQYELIQYLRSALRTVLKPESDCPEILDSSDKTKEQSTISDIIDYHNTLIGNLGREIAEIIDLIDLAK